MLWTSLVAIALFWLYGCSGSGSEASEYRWMWTVSGSNAEAIPQGDGSFRVIVDGLDRSVLQFSNRPQRAQEAVASSNFFPRWGKIFAGDPPNAVLAAQTAQGVRQWAVTISSPEFDDSQGVLTFTAVELPHVDGKLRTGPVGLDTATNVTLVIDDSVLAGDPRFQGADSDVIERLLNGPILDLSENPGGQ